MAVESCRVLPFEVADGPANMAFDEALLEAAAAEGAAAALRTYGWSRPTLSLGYFQGFEEARSDPRLAELPVVRRPTGGGAILHDRELTYAVVLPSRHPLSRRPDDLYAAIHGAFVSLLAEEGIAAARRGDSARGFERTRPFLCFTDRDPEDIVVGRAKVVGSAQRRRSGAVLQHGSLLLAASPATPDLPGLAELAGAGHEPSTWAERAARRIPEALGLTPRRDEATSRERERAKMLEREVYRRSTWTLRR